MWSVHLYGHVHNSMEEDYYQEYIKKLNSEYEIKCVAKNVGCMLWSYTPVTLKEILNDEGE